MTAPAALPGGQQATDLLSIGTLNVRALAGRLGSVLTLATLHCLDVIALQETRVPSVSGSAVVSAAHRAGWTTFLGSQGYDPQGHVQHGTVILSRVPAVRWALPEAVLPSGRGQALAVSRPRARPLLLVCVYLPSGDEISAAALLAGLLEYLEGAGEDSIIIGDFNITAGRRPISTACATGRWHAMDEAVLGDVVLPGTHRNPRGELTGRTIDFGMASQRVVTRTRHQTRGPADHDLVSYGVQGLPRDPAHRLPIRRTLATDTVTPDAWQALWQPQTRAWTDARAARDLNAAWTLLSDAAEGALGASLRGRQSHGTGPASCPACVHQGSLLPNPRRADPAPSGPPGIRGPSHSTRTV